jgi:PAS domain S-box-containing protein
VNTRDERLKSLGKTREALYVVDQEQRIIYWNEGARKLFGYAEADVLGKPCWRVIAGRRGSRQWCRKDCRAHRCVLQNAPPSGCYFETHTKAGQPIWVKVGFLLLQVDGKPVSAHILTNVTREERMREALLRKQGSLRVHELIGPALGTMDSTSQEKISCLQEAAEACNLTRRETEVLKFLAEGLSTQGIASRAGISYFTARNHIQNGLRKIGLHSRAQAVSFVYSYRLQ